MEKDPTQEIVALTTRTMSYTGKFEPVKWKCRAPLPSGKLCERMDREKVGLGSNDKTNSKGGVSGSKGHIKETH